METDYAFFYRREVDVARLASEVEGHDVFISAFNSSDRVAAVFDAVNAKFKIWLMHPEYHYTPLDFPHKGEIVQPQKCDEVCQVDAVIKRVNDLNKKTVCIDITGFMRHVLVFLFAKLKYVGVKKVTVFYSEPEYYSKQEDTVFSTTTSGVVRPVRGMFGSGNSDADDYLILGVGYDHRLISEVANYKDNTVIYPVFAFPSLSPDMYQQSAIRASQSGEIALENGWVANRRFAPANDPFSTAEVLHELVKHIEAKNVNANIYISPLSTKAQALGFSLFWIRDRKKFNSAISVIIPECETYARETSVGIKRLWEYRVEFDDFYD